jgi:DNA-binding transcriptional MerR regulator
MTETLAREAEEEAARSIKSPEAFRTISEAAAGLDVPQHVLRFWETRFSQIRPMKRGGGRRYYRPADIDLLKGIRHLLYGQGYTIRGVQRILKEKGSAHVIALGRSALEAASAAPAQPVPLAVAAGRKPRIVAGGDDATASDGRQAPARLTLSREQVTNLREALADLLWARRILSGSGNTH